MSTDTDSEVILNKLKYFWDVITLTRVPVIYQDKDYIILIQYAFSYCEIVEVEKTNHSVKLVHFS